MLGQYDQILGLDLFKVEGGDTPSDELRDVLDRRTTTRQEAQQAGQEATKKSATIVETKFGEADALRDELAQGGYVVEDTRDGTRLRPKSPWERRRGGLAHGILFQRRCVFRERAG